MREVKSWGKQKVENEAGAGRRSCLEGKGGAAAKFEMREETWGELSAKPKDREGGKGVEGLQRNELSVAWVLWMAVETRPRV